MSCNQNNRQNEGDHIQSSANAKTGNVNYLINPEIFSGANTRSNDKLVPNNDIEIVQVDPAFEPKLFFVKIICHCGNFLQLLIKNPENNF